MIHLVINPAGAGGKAEKAAKKVIQILEEQKEPYEIYESSVTHSISEILAFLTADEKQKDVVLVGGDGTLNQAVNGIQNFDSIRLGFVPCGSGNDFARSVHIKKGRDNILQILKHETKRVVDIHEVIYEERSNIIQEEQEQSDHKVHHRFIVSCGMGFDAEICQKVQVSRAKKVLNHIGLGKLIYILIALKAIFLSDDAKVKVSCDNKAFQLNQMLFLVGMNEPYEGGGFQFCPHADDYDGLLHYCYGDSISKLKFLLVFPFAYRGKHLLFSGIQEEKTKRIELQSNRPLWIHTDGEVTCASKHVVMQAGKFTLQFLN